MKKKKKGKLNKINPFIVYSGIGIQMGVTIYLGSLVGKWLDVRYETEKPLYTLSFVFLFFIISMYSLIKRLNKMNKNE